MAKSNKFSRLIKISAIIGCLILLLSLNSNSTVAWLQSGEATVINRFSGSRVRCEVLQDFDPATNSVKDVKIRNTGDLSAYVRVRLIVYRKNVHGQIVGAIAQMPTFTVGQGWIKHEDGYYYFTVPVNQTETTKPLISQMNLASYPDGEYQTFEVLAEALQSFPQDAIQDAWRVEILKNKVIKH